MKKTTTKPTYNGPVHVEVKAATVEEARALIANIPGLTVSDDYAPVPMDGGTIVFSGTAASVTDLPENVTLWPKAEYQIPRV